MAITLTSKIVTIKKQHTCYSCYRKSPIGDKMHYWTGLYEDQFNACYACMTCLEIMKLSKDNEFPEGYVREMLNDHETPEELLKRYKNGE